MRRWLQWTIVALGLAAALAHPARAAEPEFLPAIDDKWRHHQSPNFELYSHQGDSRSRELLHHLELLRATFLERFKFVERAHLDVTIFYFRTLEEFRAYASPTMAKNEFFKGFYLHGRDRAVICVAPIDEWANAQPLIFHEYVHHLFRVSDADPPAWFNEGMAELFATIRVSGDTLEIGHPSAGRLFAVQTEKLLPLERLFGIDYDSPVFKSNDHTGIFYAEAWALLHYLHFGDSGLGKEAVGKFLKVAGERRQVARVNLRVFFQECFQMDYPEMERRLDVYVSGGRYRYGRQPAPKIAAEKTYAVRAVPRDEARLRLAELALRVNRAGAGKFVLIDAIAKGAQDPRLFEALGNDALAEHDQATACERWEQALAAGSNNAAILRELGVIESRGWFQRFDITFRLPKETAERLRTRLLASIQREPEQSATYEMLAWVEAFSEEPVIANLNLVQQRFATLREKAKTVLALAFVRTRLNRRDEAIALLNDLETLGPDPSTAHAARYLRAHLLGEAAPRSPRVATPTPPPILPPRIRPPPVQLPQKVDDH